MVELTVSDGVAWITLDRPQRLNALDLESVRQYAAHLETLREREDVRVVVTRGNGRAFCAGSDVREMAPMSTAEATSAERRHGESFAMLDALPQPTIALLHGYVLGGGLGLAIYHDFRIAASSATLGLPEVELGWTPPWAMGRLVDVVGGAHARWLAMTCAQLTATAAHAIGLVNEVVADDTLGERGEALARKLAGLPAEGLRRTKALFNEMSPWRAAHWDAQAAAAFEHGYDTPDARERVAAFVARRKRD